ncbi:fused MFS/spermidine synthase [Chloroflexota bacterium]
MLRIPMLFRVNTIVFIGSFCVMVIELIAARILAPYIGVSLYTWTSIIGVILMGIALGNYLGGKIADRYPSYLVLVAIFSIGGLLTILILPALKIVTSGNWFDAMPVMWDFMLKTSCIFLLPAIVLSMVSPLVIKLTLADLGHTGGIVGTIYATSTAGAILGTFMTGFYFILWFGTSKIVWLVGGVLILTGIIILIFWPGGSKWRLSLRNLLIWTAIIEVMLVYLFFLQARGNWEQTYTRESNYFTIQVQDYRTNMKRLLLDNLVHGYVHPEQPSVLVYGYEQIFREILDYIAEDNPAPKVLHLGGGSYTFPRFIDIVFRKSVNEVVEIDPVVTEVAYDELGLPQDTRIITYNQDARLFLIKRKPVDKYDIVIGDVFNDKSTPYHLTTLEFDSLVKSHMKEDGVYMINIVDNYKEGRYMPSFIHTLNQVFRNVYLFSRGETEENDAYSTFVILATDRHIELNDYKQFITGGGTRKMVGTPYDENRLGEYLSERDPILLIDDHVPTDILVSKLFR